MAGRTEGGGGGYERRDTNVSTLAWLLVALLAGILAILVLMKGLYGHLAALEERRPATPSTLAGARSNIPPEPRLQNMPLDDLNKMRVEEDAILSSYGWVDRQAGIVRIPIERALEIAGKKALPGEQAPAALPEAGR